LMKQAIRSLIRMAQLPSLLTLTIFDL